MVAAVAAAVEEGHGREKVDVVIIIMIVMIISMIVMLIIITKVDVVLVDGEVGVEVDGVVEGARNGTEKRGEESS